jgi:hypothetical protein
MPHRFIEEPYLYGPITEEELNNLAVNHRMTYINNQIFIGTFTELEYLRDRLIERPPTEPIILAEPE